MNVNAIKLIRRAREILKEGGWIKGHYSNPYGQHCAVGAMIEAKRELLREADYFSTVDAYDEAMRTLARQLDSSIKFFDSEYVVVNFNDRGDTTRDDVLRLFNNSIRKLKEA